MNQTNLAENRLPVTSDLHVQTLAMLHKPFDLQRKPVLDYYNAAAAIIDRTGMEIPIAYALEFGFIDAQWCMLQGSDA